MEMEQDVSAAIPRIISEIPVDLFITRKRFHGDLTFTNGNGDLIFTLDQTSSIFHLLDAQGISLFSISRDKFGWQGCVGDSKDPVFKVKITRHSYCRREAEVFSFDKDLADFVSVFKMRGCPFHRSCTIYQHNQILAQTSLMYKLRKLITGRRRFRLTIFPGYISHSLLAALVVIFFHGSIVLQRNW